MELWTNWWRSFNVTASWLLRVSALFIIAVYRTTLSGWMGGACRFRPTCSHYAQIAFETHPPLTAFVLTLRRLGKCHPLGSFGYDPVPEKELRFSGTPNIKGESL